MRLRLLFSAFLVLAPWAAGAAHAQTFTRLTDLANPVVADPGGAGFAGTNWIDADEDGLPDLFVAGVALYRNLGAGQFAKVVIPGNTAGFGSSWADVDNDGDNDLMIVGSAAAGGGRLFRNDGATFTRVTGGVIGDSLGNTGWSCAWGDYDADGLVDLVIAQAAGFTGSGPNHLLHNDGGLGFSRDFSTDVTASVAPHTVPSWCDFDLDGDLDLSIGSGPVSSLGPDYFYRNTRIGGGAPLLDRVTGGALATDLRDGQVVNWIDYDNDGDLDCFITNYNNRANHLYRNDGGVYVRMTSVQAGPIASDVGVNLASVWNDYDNDGDLDCFVGRTAGHPCRYYRNEGGGMFTSLEMGTLTSNPSSTVVAADYDRDGDVDLYVSAPGPGKGLYRNDLDSGAHWLEVRLTGTASNRAAIGTRIRVKATIGGEPRWQMREVSAQNSFNGHSEFVQHVGLGDASRIDSLEIHWPLGRVEVFVDLPADTLVTIVENASPTATAAAWIGAHASGGGVTLAWHGAGLGLASGAVVERRGFAGSWLAIGTPSRAGPDRLEFFDPAPAGRWAYRLRFAGDDGEVLTSEAWVEVPEARLALEPPAIEGDRLRVGFALPRAGAVRLQVVDVSGRAWRTLDLGELSAGSHEREIDGARLAPGVYWVRLHHPDGAVAARLAVTR